MIKILENSENNFTNLRVIIVRTTAYSMIALKILKMQVKMKLSMAFCCLEAAAGALALEINVFLFFNDKMKHIT